MNSDSFNIKLAPKNIGNASITDNKVNIDALSISEQEKQRFEQDTKHRNWLVIWVMIIISSWLTLVLILVYISTFLCPYFCKEIIITLLATTTVNVLGLPYIILHGLFDNK